MTSEARDASLTDGKPVKFFRFTRGTVHWHYTNADRELMHDGATYLPTAISHSEIKDGSEPNKASITITMPQDLPVAGNWRPFPPGDRIVATIMTQHLGEADVLVDWIGRVTSPQFDDVTLQLLSEPTTTTARRGGRGRVFSRACDLVHYSQGPGLCNVDPVEHALPAVVSNVAGLAVTATAFLALPSGRLAGGWVEWTRADGLIERRSIDAHVGDTITIDYGAQDLASDLAVTAYPGCAHNWADCGYYANQDNYGGELWIPGRNFYDGNPVR